MGESHINFRMQCVITTLAGRGRREELLLMTFPKLEKFLVFKVYVLLQPICAGEVSVEIVIL